jgi:uracil-DNA glycosylase
MAPSDDATMTHRPLTGGAGGRLERFLALRARTEHLVRDLSAEDQLAQSMPDASPTKWHLAHTTCSSRPFC